MTRRRTVLYATGGLLAWPWQALAAGSDWQSCQVIGIEAPLWLRLADGRLMRPAGIAWPSPPQEANGVAKKLADRMAALTAGSGLMCRSLGQDRYGRVLGLVRLGDGRLLQESLLAEGSVLFWPEGLALPEFVAWRQVEAAARLAGQGIWAPELGLIERAESVRAFPMRLVLVEGRVQEIGKGGSWLHLNFGTQRDLDFTCRIEMRARKRFAWGGLAVDQLAGRNVRVRGWLLQAGGPLLDLSDPGQLELL